MHVSDPCIEHISWHFLKKNIVTEFTRPGVRNCPQCVRSSPIWRGVRFSDFYYVHQWRQSPNKEIIWKLNIDHRAKRTVALYDEMRHRHGPKEPREARSVRNSAHWPYCCRCLIRIQVRNKEQSLSPEPRLNGECWDTVTLALSALNWSG